MSGLDRRSMLGLSFWGVGAALAGSPALAASGVPKNPYADDGVERWIIDDTSAVADTESGKVVGYVRNGVRIFKGVPYAEILSAQDRWKRGAKVRPWAGKRSSRAQGLVCPPDTVGNTNAAQGALDEVLFQHYDNEPTRPGENCLNLNVWTPGTDTKKRHVMVYFHGGLTNASSLFEGKCEFHNLARYGDVVVVSMNFRQHALGFLDLTSYGPAYADSASLGMFDMIDALKWVRANIAYFGGDPDKVTIFGQSAGGGRVMTLLAMPEAKGLFHRAISQSPDIATTTPEEAAARTATFLKLAGVAPGNHDALQKLPMEVICRAAVPLSVARNNAREHFATWKKAGASAWLPVVDGRNLLYDPAHPTAPCDVPLLIGTTLHETYGAIFYPDDANANETKARDIVRSYFGPIGDDVYNIYKGEFSAATPFEISAIARSTGHFRGNCMKLAQKRAALNSARTYNYWVHWRANILEGRAGSHHEIEMPLVYMNSDATPSVTGATAEARALSVKMADVWLAFAKAADPNTSALPHWNPVTPTAMSTMVFNNSCHIDHGSDLAAIDMFWKSRFPQE